MIGWRGTQALNNGFVTYFGAVEILIYNLSEIYLNRSIFLKRFIDNLSTISEKCDDFSTSIMGNPMICATGKEKGCNEKKPMTLYSNNQQSKILN